METRTLSEDLQTKIKEAYERLVEDIGWISIPDLDTGLRIRISRMEDESEPLITIEDDYRKNDEVVVLLHAVRLFVREVTSITK